jgi:prophage DNA circulation protein
MSFKWPNKDPDEQLDYSVDWSRFLNGATISSITWYVDNASGVKTTLAAGTTVNGIQNVAQTISGGVATINLGLGTNNTEYKFTCRMVDNTGNIAERVIRLRVKEQ